MQEVVFILNPWKWTREHLKWQLQSITFMWKCVFYNIEFLFFNSGYLGKRFKSKISDACLKRNFMSSLKLGIEICEMELQLLLIKDVFRIYCLRKLPVLMKMLWKWKKQKKGKICYWQTYFLQDINCALFASSVFHSQTLQGKWKHTERISRSRPSTTLIYQHVFPNRWIREVKNLLRILPVTHLKPVKR